MNTQIKLYKEQNKLHLTVYKTIENREKIHLNTTNKRLISKFMNSIQSPICFSISIGDDTLMIRFEDESTMLIDHYESLKDSKELTSLMKNIKKCESKKTGKRKIMQAVFLSIGIFLGWNANTLQKKVTYLKNKVEKEELGEFVPFKIPSNIDIEATVNTKALKIIKTSTIMPTIPTKLVIKEENLTLDGNEIALVEEQQETNSINEENVPINSEILENAEEQQIEEKTQTEEEQQIEETELTPDTDIAENVIEALNRLNENTESEEILTDIDSEILEESKEELVENEVIEQQTNELDAYIEEQEQIQTEEERVKEEREYIELYCNIYGLDFEKVYQSLSDITNNFMDKSYIENYIIGDSKLKKRSVLCNSKEMALLIAVRNMYYNPSRYGYPYDDLKTGTEYTSDLDYSHQIAYICNILGIDPALSYAICLGESNFNSDQFLYQNNPAGIRFDTEYETFPSKTAGFVEQALELLKYQIDGRTTIEEIGERYAPTSDPRNLSWVPNITNHYNYAIDNYEILFGNEELEEEKVYALNE